MGCREPALLSQPLFASDFAPSLPIHLGEVNVVLGVGPKVMSVEVAILDI